MSASEQRASSELRTDDLLLIADKLADTLWQRQQLQDVATLTQGLLDGVNRLQNFRPSTELPVLRYHLPDWE